ncbi:hypothetical protein LAZ67_2005487, partial [Cordylochernes scorpioides]
MAANLTPPLPMNMNASNLFAEYKQWMESYAIFEIASGISKKSDEIKRATLLHCLGPNVQRIFFNLPDEKENYEQTKMALDKYFTPHKNVVTERFKFRQRVQKDDESIYNYLISLRELSKSCEFGNLEADMIRDQIIEKCNNKKLKEKLLEQENLTLSKTIDIARMLEISRKEIRLLEPQNDQTLSRVQNKPEKHYNANNFNKSRFTNQEEIYVIDKKVESLLGGKASFELGIIKRVNHVNESMSTNIETLVQEHEHLFHGLGTIKGYSHKVTLKDNYRPIAQRCRRIPYAMVEAVNQELDKMLENGIIEEVHQGSEWVSNIIVVPKRDSEEIRLCIDHREVNKAILRERHPIPTIDNMLHALKGAKVFAKLDAKKGFWQSISSAPEAYQKGMDSILLDLKGVICYLDDVVVYAKDRQELEERLRKVLQRFDKVGIRLNRNKCKFAMEELDILGHIVSSEGKQNIADIFSRQPLSNTSDEKWLEDYVHNVLSITSEELQALSLKEIKVCTEQDPLFQKLKDMVQKGVWPYPLNEEFKCFYKFKDELSIFDNLILKGSRILLPSKLIKRVLRIAHETHQGMTRTKQLLREKYFWINMDFDIENLIRNCPIYVRNQPLINDQPLQIVPLPSKPWMKLGIDIVGPIGHHYVLTVIDYYSSYPEAMIIEDISSKTIIKKLMEIFARHGNPHEVVTDNGLQFVSTSMERFLKECGIRHIKASPYSLKMAEISWVPKEEERSIRRSRRLQGLTPDNTATMNNRSEASTQVSPLFCQNVVRNPSMFSGEISEDPQAWLKGYERVASHNHWDDSLSLANVYFYLHGTAQRWYENNEENIPSWEIFKDQLGSVFGKKDNLRRQAEQKLKVRAQTRGETTEFYIQDVLRLCREVDAQMPEEERLSHLMKGVAEEVYRYLLPRDIATTDQFIAECRRVVALQGRRVTVSKFERLPNVTSLGDLGDVTDLQSLIRQIVREEVQRALAPPREEPRISFLEEIVKEEVDKVLAPMSGINTFPMESAARSAPRNYRKNTWYAPKVEASGSRVEVWDTNEWRNQTARPYASTVDGPATLSAIAATGGELFIRKDVIFPSSLIEFEEGIGKIWITNGGLQPQMIPKGMNLGRMCDIETEHVCLLSVEPESFSRERREDDHSVHLLSLINPDLPKKKKEDLMGLLLSFKRVFLPTMKNANKVQNRVKHRIHTGDHPPINHRVSKREREIMQKEVDAMLERKVIQPSESPWSAPVVLVKKKDGTWRFCVDFRRLNHITKKEVYPLPRIDDVLDHLSSARYYSTMDLKTGYWQVEVDERDREKTAFVTPDGLYEFMVMPFGLCNAPATFERMMHNVLMGLKWNICLCYLDDIVVYSVTFEEHLERLSKVLSCLQQAGLTINPDKCLFGSTRIKILGHVVDKDGIQPDSEKVEAIKKFPVPKSVCDIQSYLGLCSYYRRFIKNFSKIAAPLQILLKKDQKFIWTQEQKDSFESLKKTLMQKPVLGHFKESAITKLHTDASSYGLGAVLVQIQENQENLIAYASRTLSKAEKNYSTTERECLTVIWAIGKFRPYLYGRPFEVVSDHHSLCWLAGLKDPSGRLARWALKLQDFDATITYKSGVKHKDADCLSRYPLPESPALTSLTLKIGMDLLGWFPLSDKGNRWIIVCTDYLTKYAIAKALPSGTAAEIATFILEEVILKHGAPREIITDRGRAFMSQMFKEVTSRCKISHLFTTAYHPQTNGLTERLNKTLGDMLSMYVDAEQRDWDSVLPYVIFAYNTAQQGSTRFSPFFLVHGREAETLLDVLLPYEDETSDHDFGGQMVTKAEEARQLARIHILRAQENNKYHYDQVHRSVEYRVGDLVWVFTPVRKTGFSEKLLKKYFGPYKITRKVSEVNYEVEALEQSSRRRRRSQKDVVHVLRMKPYRDPGQQLAIQTQNQASQAQHHELKESMGLKFKCLEDEISSVEEEIDSSKQKLAAVETDHPRTQ